jgi:hypothetical protein
MRAISVEGKIHGRPAQSVLEQSATQKYPIGFIYDDLIGRRWRYCKAVAAIAVASRGCPAMQPASWTAGAMSMGSDSTTITGSQGDSKVLIFTGADYDEAHAKDYFYGGTITIFPSAGDVIYRHVVTGNDASFTSDTYFWAYIDPPLAADCSSVPCDVMSSPYAFVGAPGSVGTAYSVVCVPSVLVTQYYYFWGQTRGPAFVTPNAEWTTAATREAEFHTDGTIKAGAGVALQRAGYIIYGNGADADANVMLMLD